MVSERHPVAFNADLHSVTRLRQPPDVCKSSHLFIDPGHTLLHRTLRDQNRNIRKIQGNKGSLRSAQRVRITAEEQPLVLDCRQKTR